MKPTVVALQLRNPFETVKRSRRFCALAIVVLTAVQELIKAPYLDAGKLKQSRADSSCLPSHSNTSTVMRSRSGWDRKACTNWQTPQWFRSNICVRPACRLAKMDFGLTLRVATTARHIISSSAIANGERWATGFFISFDE
eukprot:6199980-Pleurochrysis_carterae.AAC.1